MAIKFLNSVAVDTDVLFVDTANERVGIGTASPGAKLDIYGESVSTNRYSLQTFSSTGQPVISIYNSNSDATPVPRIVGTNSYINMYNGVTVRKTAGSGNILTVNDPSNSEKFIVDASGNVGIGTTSPGEKLEVAGDMNLYNPSLTSQINFRNIGGANYIKSNGYSTQFGLRGNTGNGVFIIENSLASTQDIRIKPTTSGWDFSSRGVAGVNALLTIDSVLNVSNRTNVGIGTTTPDRPLSVVGGNSMVARFQSTNTTSFIQFSNTVSTADQVRIGSNGTNLVLSTNYAERMRITSGGNVGIGTTSPDYPLHVDDTIKIGDRQGTDGSLILQSQQGPNITFKSTGDILDISGTTGATNGNSIRLSDNIKKLYFNGGIGGTIAINRGNRGLMDSNIGGLEVQQQNTASSNGKSTFLSTSSSGTILRSTSYGSTGTSGDIQFQFGGGANTSEPSPTTKMVIKNSGNVGIGTTSPSTALDVAGSITTSGALIGPSIFEIIAQYTNRGRITLNSSTNTGANQISLLTDGNTRMVVNKEGNVGIGTTAPSAALEVVGGIKLSDNSPLTWATSNTRIFGQSGYMQLQVASTDVMRLTSAGNVGIGTTAPSTPLHINNAAPTIRLQDSSSGDNHYLTGNNGEFRVQTSGYMTMRPGNTVSTTFLANGNVGIGDTSPSKKLTVNGQTQFYEYGGAHLTNAAHSNFNFDTLANNSSSSSGGSLGAFIKVTASPTGATGTWSAIRARAYAENTQGNTDNLINFFAEYRNYTSTNAVTLNHHSGLKVQSLGVGGLATVTNNYGVYLDVGTAATNNYGVYQAGTSVKNFFQGNVGIGTTNPQEKLDISAGNIRLDDNQRISWSSSDSNIGRVRITGNESNDFITIATDNSERMRIASSGNVGIGTTAPSTSLHVKSTSAGSGYMTIENTVHYSKLDLKSTTYTGSIIMDGTGGYVSGGGLILNSGTNVRTQFLQGGVAKMIINNGNVGIGTTSPEQRLHISSSGSTLMRITGGGSSIAGIDFGDSTNTDDGRIRYDNSSRYMQFVVADSERMRITSSGNVGIGTTSPQEKLDVAGALRVKSELSSNNIVINGGDSGNLATITSRGNGISIATGTDFGATHIKLLPGGSGNVGIGTTSPTQKLEVDGEVLSDGYRLSAMQTAPAARNSTGTLGEIRITSNYIYVCYATNSWSRVALATSW